MDVVHNVNEMSNTAQCFCILAALWWLGVLESSTAMATQSRCQQITVA